MKSSAEVADYALNSNPMQIDRGVAAVSANRAKWAAAPVSRRIDLLTRIRDALVDNAKEWSTLAAAAKGLPADPPLVAEEWISGPWAALIAIDILLRTLTQLDASSLSR